MKKVVEARVPRTSFEDDAQSLPTHRVSFLEVGHDTSRQAVVARFWNDPDDKFPISHALSAPAAKLLSDLLLAEIEEYLRSGEVDS